MIFLNTIRTEDIDEKIRINEKLGMSIHALQDHIKKELNDFQWTVIRAQVQCQCYVEQLEHIGNRIKEFEATGAKNWELHEVTQNGV